MWDKHFQFAIAFTFKVWGLEGCHSKGQTMRKNRSVRFGFGGSTVLVVCSEDQVSFYTTGGGGLGALYLAAFAPAL